MLLDLIALYKVHNGMARLTRMGEDEKMIPNLD